MHHDGAQQREKGFGLVPDPCRELLAGRVLQAGDLVEIVMVEAIQHRLEDATQIGEIHHPAGMWVRFTRYMQFDAERMSMQTCAFVPVRNVGQPVRGLEGETLEDVHAAHSKAIEQRKPAQDQASSNSIAITIASSRPPVAG